MGTNQVMESRRSTRSKSKTAETASRSISPAPAAPPPTTNVKPLPAKLDSKITGMSKDDVKILHAKQQKLADPKMQAYLQEAFGSCTRAKASSANRKPDLTQAVKATLVFAQYEAGTAACISSTGILLTCSHCVAESEEELKRAKSRKNWLIFSSGQVVQAEPIVWDPRRDLALLKIIAAQRVPVPCSNIAESTSSIPDATAATSTVSFTFPHIAVGSSPPSIGVQLICVGHPGSEDLEAAQAGVKTGYDVVHISTGKFRGYAQGQDLQDNADIGALKHDCWTYWGHSGAPIIDRARGEVIGLHSSWDESTLMRRGVPLEAIQEFLQLHEY